MKTKGSNRRSFMQSALVAAGGGLAATHAGTDRASAAEVPARAFRFVHFGDTHVGAVTHSGGNTRYADALGHVHAIADSPEFILHTGDIVTDSFWATQASALAQWDVYLGIMQEHCTLPVHYTLGNHDVNFGWDGGGAFHGKNTALAKLGLTSPYYSFDHKGWHFIVLDDTQQGGRTGFVHHLDEAQYAWLENDLAQTDPDTPIIISSHAPILTMTSFLTPGTPEHADGIVIPNDWVHMDVIKLHELFMEHGNVRLCLSGHFHMVDHVQYLGVHYICGGAVCGDYWRRPLPYAPENESGYGVIDLFPDGSFEYWFTDYGMVGFEETDPDRPRYSWEQYRVNSGSPPGGYPPS